MACTTSMNCDPHFKSLDKMNNYPIINDSIVLALSYYQWLKSKNKMIDNTLSKAEKTLKTVKDTAEPFAVRNLGFVDNVVFNQLERLEKKCPIILEPSKAITIIPSKIYQDNIQFAVDTMMWPVTKTLDTVSKTSTMAMSTMSSMMESSVRKVLPVNEISSNTSSYLLKITDEFLNKYLPDNDDKEESDHNLDLYSKIKYLSRKTQNRIVKLTIEQIKILWLCNINKLDQIQSFITDMKKRKNDFQNSILENYGSIVGSIKDNIPAIISNHTQFIKEIITNAKQLQTSISVSAVLKIEYLLNYSLDGLTVINRKLDRLQRILKDSKPEFISENLLIHTNDTIGEIRIGLDSFIHNMKDHLDQRFHGEEWTRLKNTTEINKKTFYFYNEANAYSDSDD